MMGFLAKFLILMARLAERSTITPNLSLRLMNPACSTTAVMPVCGWWWPGEAEGRMVEKCGVRERVERRLGRSLPGRAGMWRGR